MGKYTIIQESLKAAPKKWVVTGVAGFIGSHILERLLILDQDVVGIDNFATGSQANLDAVQAAVDPAQWKRFEFVKADICDQAAMMESFKGASVVLHQAALGSVPRSVRDPLTSFKANVDGTASVFWAAHQCGIERIVFASSSSVYGDNEDEIKTEERTGQPLSPYAATKASNELYGAAFANSYGMTIRGLRYFNVFGPRQDPAGEYAAVIPRWLGQLSDGEQCVIYGDGKTSRDFCYVENVVQANILAGASDAAPGFRAYNIAVGDTTDLTQLYGALATQFWSLSGKAGSPSPVSYAPFRTGDIKNSQANITRAQTELGYEPAVRVTAGFERVVKSFVKL